MMRRYLHLFGVQLRTSLLVAMQYRLEFFLDGVMSMFWTASAVAPLLVLFDARKTVAGWTWPEALLVVGAFTTLKGVLDGAIQPSLSNVVEHVRKGTLDFLLLKPADAQFMVSTARFEPWRGGDLWLGLLLFGWAFHALGRTPTVGGVLLAGVLLAAAIAILYSISILVISLAFFVVKVDNLIYLFLSIYDASRWPASIFRGALAIVFTFVIPLAVMTTFPALALLGKLTVTQAAGAIAGAALFTGAARVVWLRSIAHYTSAGG
jgi:ABC-2 type transport system permease protein